jgi:ADP-heptose:LPS heptosyltransferase
MEPLRLRDGDGVLLMRLGAVGDVVRTLPCLAALRRAAPTIRLGWAVEAPSAPLLPGHPWLDETFIFPRGALAPARLLREPFRGVGAFRAFLARVRAFRPVLSIDFQGSAKSALLARLSGAPFRLGFDRTGAREGSFLCSNIRVRPSSARINRVQKNLELLRPVAPSARLLEFPFRGEGPSGRVRTFLETLGERVRVVVHAGTSLRQNHKQWPPENYAKVVASFAREGWAPVLTWGPGEESLVRTVQVLSGNGGVPTPPLDLEEMRQVIARCHLFVGGDTGPMHLAWSQGVPVVALFGSTDPSINGPLGEGHRVIAPAWEGNGPYPPRGDRSAIRRVDPGVVVKAALDSISSRKATNAGVPGR